MTPAAPGGPASALRFNSLSVKLILFSAAATVLVVGATFFALRTRVESEVRAVFEQDLRNGQRRLKDLQTGNLKLLLATSSIVSTNSTLRAALGWLIDERNAGQPLSEGPLQTVQEEAQKVFTDLDKDVLIITDDSARVVASVGEGAPPPGTSLATVPSVQHALFTLQADPDSSFGVLRTSPTGFRVPMQIGSVAIVQGGYLTGVLILGERIDSILPRLDDGDATQAVVTIDNVVVITSDEQFAAPGDVWQRTAGGSLQRGGAEYITAALALGLAEDGKAAELIVARSLTAILTPITASLGRSFLWFGVIAVLLASAGAALASRTSLRPLARFVGFMREGAETGAYAKFSERRAPAEIATLTDAFNRLIDSLGRQHEQLEHRSVELASSNEALRSEISERERAELALRASEEQLRQSQKLEALGTLAGGVAHDFNNLLSVIMGYAHFSMEELKPGDPMRDDINSIVEAGERASGLVRQLLAFSRKQVLQPQIVDMNQVVTGMRSMLRRLIGEDIDLRMELAPDLPSILADRGQLEQVLLNLVVNARDAMPKGGLIMVETNCVDVDDDFAHGPEPMAAGPAVSLSVSDSGVGMDAATRQRIFEPFFTTKDPGKGTGLGLSTVYGIVRQSGGTIRVDSEPGEGATFCAYFPAVAGPGIAAVSAVVDSTLYRGEETVLVAEDDALMRGMVHRCLRDRGYRVLEAADGRRALELAAAHDGPIDLLVSDVIMPHVSGRDLADRIRVARPAIKVLFMSGHTEEAVERHGVVLSSSRFLPKPITPDSLARAVRDALDGTSRGTGE